MYLYSCIVYIESGHFWSAKKLKQWLALVVVTTYYLKKYVRVLLPNVVFQWVLVLNLLAYHLEKVHVTLLARYNFILLFLLSVRFAMKAFKDIHLSKFVSTVCILLRIVSKMRYLLSFLFAGSWTWKKVRHHISGFMEFNSTWMQIAKVYNLLGNYVLDDPD